MSNRRLQANQQNAQLSTGPRSPQGKACSSRNAVTLGLFSSQLLLPGEDAQQLQTLRNGLLSSLRPANALEAMLVERIVAMSWKLQRTARAEQMLHLQEAEERREDFADEFRAKLGLEPRSWQVEDGLRVLVAPELPPSVAASLMLAESNPALEKLHQHETKLENSILRLLKELRELRKNRSGDDSADQSDFWQNEATEPSSPSAETNADEPTEQNASNRQNEAKESIAEGFCTSNAAETVTPASNRADSDLSCASAAPRSMP